MKTGQTPAKEYYQSIQDPTHLILRIPEKANTHFYLSLFRNIHEQFDGLEPDPLHFRRISQKSFETMTKAVFDFKLQQLTLPL